MTSTEKPPRNRPERRIAPDGLYFFTVSLLFLALAGQFVIALVL